MKEKSCFPGKARHIGHQEITYQDTSVMPALEIVKDDILSINRQARGN